MTKTRTRAWLRLGPWVELGNTLPRLGKLDPVGCRREIVLLIDDADDGVARFAVEAIGQAGREAAEALPALLRAANRKSLRTGAIQAIGQLKSADPRAATLLLSYLKD